MPTTESISTMQQGSYVSLGDGRYAMLITGTAGGAGPAALEMVIPVVARVTSTTATGSVAAPGAGASIAATGALALGTWDIEIDTAIGGTTVAAVEMDNMEVTLAGAAKTRIINPVPGTAGAAGNGRLKFRFDGAGIVAVRAAAAATAASRYAATIVATRVN